MGMTEACCVRCFLEVDTYSIIMTFDVMVEMCETIALHVFRIDRVFLDN